MRKVFPRQLVSALLLLLSRPALAQPAPAPAPSLTLPPPPPVSDPMLTPVPAAKRTLASWDEAIGYLRARSTDLRIALDQVLTAEAQTRTALAAYLPTINAGGNLTHNFLTTKSSPSSESWVTRAGVPVSVVQNGNVLPGIFNPGGVAFPAENTYGGNITAQQALLNVPNFDQIGIARINETANRLSVEDKKRTLALSLANQIVAVVTAERSAEINRVGLKVALEQLEITRRKQALGAANGLDVVRAEQNAANARASLVSGDESLHEAREALGLALGVPEETGVAQDVNIDGLAQSAMATCRAVSDVEARPDIAAARTNLEVAKRNLRNVYYQFLPTVNAQSTLSFSQNPISGPSNIWNIQALLSIPIWDGGARYGSLRSARAAEDTALQNLESLRRQAIIQVAQAQRQLVVAEVSDKVAREQRDLAARNDTMTQMAYMAGQGTSLELVTASEAHRQAELNLALQDFSVVKARILAVLALATCPW